MSKPAAERPQTEPKAAAKSAEESSKPKNKYRRTAEGIDFTLRNLGTKLAELLKKRSDRQDEKDRIKGFTAGGASADVPDSEDDKELAAEIAMLQAQEESLKTQQELNEIFDDAVEKGQLQGSDDDGKGGGTFKCDSKDEAMALARSIAVRYEALGFKCDITSSKDGKNITVEIQMPKEFEGKNPLTMSADELQQAKEGVGQEAKSGAAVGGKPGASPKPTAASAVTPPDLGRGGGAAVG